MPIKKAYVIEGVVVVASSVGTLAALFLALEPTTGNGGKGELERIVLLLSLASLFGAVFYRFWKVEVQSVQLSEKLDEIKTTLEALSVDGQEMRSIVSAWDDPNPLTLIQNNAQVEEEHPLRGPIVKGAKKVLLDSGSKLVSEVAGLAAASTSKRISISNVPNVYNFMHELVRTQKKGSIYLATTKFDSYGESMPPELFAFSRTLAHRVKTGQVFASRLYYAVKDSNADENGALNSERASEVADAMRAKIIARVALVTRAEFDASSDVRDLAFVLTPDTDELPTPDKVARLFDGAAQEDGKGVFASLRSLGYKEVCAIEYDIKSTGATYGTSIDALEVFFDHTQNEYQSYKREFEHYWSKSQSVGVL